MKKFLIISLFIFFGCTDEKETNLNEFLEGNWKLINVYKKDNDTGVTDVLEYYFEQNITFRFTKNKKLIISDDNIFKNNGTYLYTVEYDFITYPSDTQLRELMITLDENNYQVDKMSYDQDTRIMYLNSVISNELSVTLRRL